MPLAWAVALRPPSPPALAAGPRAVAARGAAALQHARAGRVVHARRDQGSCRVPVARARACRCCWGAAAGGRGLISRSSPPDSRRRPKAAGSSAAARSTTPATSSTWTCSSSRRRMCVIACGGTGGGEGESIRACPRRHRSRRSTPASSRSSAPSSSTTRAPCPRRGLRGAETTRRRTPPTTCCRRARDRRGAEKGRKGLPRLPFRPAAPRHPGQDRRRGGPRAVHARACLLRSASRAAHALAHTSPAVSVAPLQQDGPQSRVDAPGGSAVASASSVVIEGLSCLMPLLTQVRVRDL